MFNALGAAEPQHRIDLLGEHCLSGASCAAILIWCGGGGIPKGPRTGENGFGSFCRNKRASAAGPKPRLINEFWESTFF